LQKFESVAVSKKFLSSDLGFPTDFYSLGGNCVFSCFKRSAVFICPIDVAIQFKTDWEEFWSESNSSGKYIKYMSLLCRATEIWKMISTGFLLLVLTEASVGLSS